MQTVADYTAKRDYTTIVSAHARYSTPLFKNIIDNHPRRTNKDELTRLCLCVYAVMRLCEISYFSSSSLFRFRRRGVTISCPGVLRSGDSTNARRFFLGVRLELLRELTSLNCDMLSVAMLLLPAWLDDDDRLLALASALLLDGFRNIGDKKAAVEFTSLLLTLVALKSPSAVSVSRLLSEKF